MSKTNYGNLVAIGIGIGWLNATVLGIPGWANILMMGALAVGGEFERDLGRPLNDD